jgi:hypothetical protein
LSAGDETIKARWNYRPDLRACELEDRLVPATPNLGATVLTTGGYVLLLSPFPVIASSPFGASGSPGFLTPSVMTGSAGGSGLLPGNSPGVPGLTTSAPTGSNRGAAVTIVVGSGADDASAPIIPLVTRNTIANDALNAAPVIGRASGDDSPVLPPGQVYRDGVPVTSPARVSTEAPGQPAGSQPDEKSADPLRIRLRKPAHRLASDAPADLVRSDVDRAR